MGQDGTAAVSVIGPARGRVAATARPSELHRIHFYEDEDALAEVAVDFLAEGHAVGDTLILFATEAHQAEFRKALTDRGIDLDAATREGTFVALDARAVLADLLSQGRMQRDRFRSIVEPLVEAPPGGRVRVYGEMVDLLWQEGNAPAALRLEELWNELCERRPFTLLRVYALGGHRRDFVPPVEGDGESLEQRCRALEAELERRKLVERVLRDTLAERRRTIVALRDRQRELADFFDAAVDGLVRVAPDGQVSFASHGARRLLGAEGASPAGRHVRELFEDPAEADRVLADLRRAGAVRDRAARLRTPAGPRDVRIDANAQVTAGRLLSTRWYLRDAPAAAEEPWPSAGALGVAADLVSDLLVVLDREGRVRHAGAAALRWLGHGPELLVGQPLSALLEDESVATLEALRDSARSGEGVRAEVRLRTPTGPRGVELRLAPLRGSGAAVGVVAVIADVGSRRAREELVARLGHELRNPLAPIVSALQLLLERHPGVAAEHAVIDRQVRRLVAMVDQLLDASLVASDGVALRRAPVDLTRVVSSAIEVVRADLESHGHQLRAAVTERPPPVVGDEGRLVQVVSQLLSNAIRSAPEGGSLAITLGSDEGDAVVRVRDDGDGMAPELVARVFEPFSQGGDGGGLGLGLATARTLVGLHGGSVEAHSDGPGNGSAFTMRLPGDSEPRAGRRGSGPLGCRILVVDDNRDAAELLSELLRLCGYDTRVAFDGGSALDVARTFRPEVALLDIGLPGLDGYEVAARLRALPGLEDIKLVAVTGYGQPSDAERSRAVGLHAHLVKPAEVAQIERVLGELFQT